MRLNAYEGYFALTCVDSRFQHNLNRTRVQRVENAHEKKHKYAERQCSSIVFDCILAPIADDFQT